MKHKMQEMLFSENPSSAKFCGKCGAALIDPIEITDWLFPITTGILTLAAFSGLIGIWLTKASFVSTLFSLFDILVKTFLSLLLILLVYMFGLGTYISCFVLKEKLYDKKM